MTIALARLRWLMLALVIGLEGCATPTSIRQTAAKGGADAVQQVNSALHSKDQPMRQAAAESLVQMSNGAFKISLDQENDARKALLEGLHSNDPGVRAEAGAALVLSPDVELQNGSLVLLQDPERLVRLRMTEGLITAGITGPAENTSHAAIYLWGMAQDNDAQVRAEAVYGLGTLGLDDPIETAIDALQKDPEARVRGAAALGLGISVRAYLTLYPSPGVRDETAEAYLAQQLGLKLADSIQLHGQEIVNVLCIAALSDKGKYTVTRYEGTLLGTREISETRWVAMDAAIALDQSGRVPAPNVATAQEAAKKFVASQMPPSSAASTVSRPTTKPHVGI